MMAGNRRGASGNGVGRRVCGEGASYNLCIRRAGGPVYVSWGRGKGKLNLIAKQMEGHRLPPLFFYVALLCHLLVAVLGILCCVLVGGS